MLWEKDAQTSAELGARLVIDSATMTGVIDRLERSGLIRREAAAGDRRIDHLHLTDRGRALRAPLDAAMEALNAEVAELLGKDWPRFHRMLRKVGVSS